ncbi:MAG: hypothetical protein ACRDLT_18745 [Solirubrobacteraceae bacterium]
METDGATNFGWPSECTDDVVALGEGILRLHPVERIRSVTALVNNEVGHLIDGLMRRSGVDVSWRRWAPCDGVFGEPGIYGLHEGFDPGRAVAPAFEAAPAQGRISVSSPTYDVSSAFSCKRIRAW